MKILSWLREGTELKALVLTRSRKGNDVIRVLSPERVAPLLSPPVLQAAWDRLARAEQLDEDLLYALVSVLLHSQAQSWQQLSLPAPELRPVRLTRPTAAHPRAYKGTKARQPKPALPAQDLRPYLQDSRWVRHLLSSLKDHWPKVRVRLNSEGISLALPDRDELETFWRRWQFMPVNQLLPERFALALHACLAGHPPDLIDGVFRRVVRWPKSVLLVPALCRLLAQVEPVTLFAFLDALAAWPPARVLDLLKTMAEASLLLPELIPVADSFLKLSRERVRSEQLEYLQWALAQDIAPDYLAAGLTLAEAFTPSYDFPYRYRPAAGGFPLEQVSAIVMHVKSGSDYNWRANDLAMLIWTRWAQVPAFAGLFAGIDWLSFPPPLCTGLLHLLTLDYHNWWWRELRPAWEGYGALLCQLASELLAGLQTIPEDFQLKWLRLLEDYFCLHFLDQPYDAKRARQAMQRAMNLFTRLAREPFDAQQTCAQTFAAWIEALSDADFVVFLNRPDAELQHIESDVEAGEERYFLRLGLVALLPVLPKLGLAGLAQAPKHLFRLCQDLGMLRATERTRVVRQLAHLPLLQDTSALTVSELVTYISPLCQPGMTSPFPRKLRLWAQGHFALTPGQLERARRLSLERLILTRLDALDALIWAEIFSEYPELPRTEPLRHALMVEKQTESSRRALRRFIRRYLAGDKDYLSAHPINQRWLDTHPACKYPAWREGLPYRCNWQGVELTLAIERDPLEVLKMGTYVSSCLRLAGSFLFAAVAALLDINKQVVFARDPAGRVIARQLIAVDERQRLVGFWVYPASNLESLNGHFWAHLQQLSAVLGLEIYHDGPDSEYEIVNLLAQDWWDDGAWDL